MKYRKHNIRQYAKTMAPKIWAETNIIGTKTEESFFHRIIEKALYNAMLITDISARGTK